MIDANDKAKIEYGRDFDAVLDMMLSDPIAGFTRCTCPITRMLGRCVYQHGRTTWTRQCRHFARRVSESWSRELLR